MTDLTKKFIVLHDNQKNVVFLERNFTGHCNPANDLQYFETDSESEFDNFLTDNNLQYDENNFIDGIDSSL